MNPYNIPAVNKSPQSIMDNELRDLRNRIEDFEYREKSLMKHLDDIKDHFHRRMTVLENDLSAMDSLIASYVDKPKKKRWWHRSKK